MMPEHIMFISTSENGHVILIVVVILLLVLEFSGALGGSKRKKIQGMARGRSLDALVDLYGLKRKRYGWFMREPDHVLRERLSKHVSKNMERYQKSIGKF